jgi:hypothetical protein
MDAKRGRGMLTEANKGNKGGNGEGIPRVPFFDPPSPSEKLGGKVKTGRFNREWTQRGKKKRSSGSPMVEIWGEVIE